MTWRKIMTETELIKEYIETLDGAITYDGCDSALIGTAKIYREEQFVEVAMYSYDLLVEHFKNEYLSDTENPISEDDAEVDAMEWVDYNIAGGYLGIRTPMIVGS